MKFQSTVVLTLCSLTLVGCNQLTQLGAQSLVFEEDPFAQLEQDQQTAASQQQQPAMAANQQGQIPGQYGSAVAQYQYQQNQTAAQQPAGSATFDPNAGLPIQNWDTPEPVTTTAYMPQTGQPAAMAGPAASGPVARAQATVNALLTQQQPQPIQQSSFEIQPDAPGVATFDFGSQPVAAAQEPETPPQFDAPPQFQAPEFSSHRFQGVDTTPSNPVVPQPHSPTFELNESLLDLPPVQQPTRDPNKFPGTNIPIPTGRASVFLDVLDDAFEPASPGGSVTPPVTPAGLQPKPVATKPVFTQPTRTDGRSIPQPTGVLGTSTSQPVPASAISPATSKPPQQKIIHDSRNDSKWRAARRR